MKTTKPNGRHLRKGRVSIPGQLYSLTMVTRNRKSYFHDFHTTRTLIRILREHEEHGYAKTLCFVVMPDHLHWLIELGDNRELAAVVRGVKSLSSRRSDCKLWQKGFYDHALRREEDIKEIARYIVLNPVRAGLVKQCNEYPHWDAVWM